MRKSLLMAAIATATLFAGATLANHHMAGAIKHMDTAQGEVLTNAAGMALYTFDKDKDGISMCTDGCAVKWPPMAAEASSMAEGDFTVIKREDGTHQWAYKGAPLYTWIKDMNAGDITGDGVKGVWHLAKP